MMKKYSFFWVICLAITLLVSCKPTENNYKEAYDAAKAKRDKEASDPDIKVPGGTLFQEDDPHHYTLAGRDVLARHEFLKLIEGPEDGFHKYNVAIASYKMTANAKSHWERVREEYKGAILIQNPKQIYFVCIGSYDTEEEAAIALEQYQKQYPEAVYVGIPQGRPVIEIKSR